MLTRKTTYGIRALASLARAGQTSLSVAELAARESIPEHFLSVILSDLRQRGIVRGRRGPDGGYQLAVEASKLNLADVVESLGGPLFPFPCLERGASPARCSECPGPSRCPAQSALGRASTAAYESLLSLVLSDLLDEPAPASGAEPGELGLGSSSDDASADSRSVLRQKRAAARGAATTRAPAKRHP